MAGEDEVGKDTREGAARPVGCVLGLDLKSSDGEGGVRRVGELYLACLIPNILCHDLAFILMVVS